MSEGEREVFLKLCVFIGSFSREAAQKISGASLKTLLGLANKSWLQHTEDGRFQLHELMRQYGEERLREDEAAWREAKNSHADFFADYVAEQAIKLTGSEQPAGLGAMELEFESNIKSAFDWLVAEGRWSDLIERMTLGLFQMGAVAWRADELVFWYREARLALVSEMERKEPLAFAILSTLEIISEEASGLRETDTVERFNTLWQNVIEDSLDEPMGFWLSVLIGIAKFRNLDLHFDERFEQGITRLRKKNLQWELAYSLGIQANWWHVHGYNEDKLYEALEIFKGVGAVSEQIGIYQRLGRQAFFQKRPPDEIIGFYQQARKLAERLGNDLFDSSINWQELADVFIQRGEIERGFELLQEAQQFAEKNGNIHLLVNYLNWESLNAVRYSTLEHAREVRLRSLELGRKLNNPTDISWSLLELGEIYRISGDFTKARDSYDQAHLIFEKIKAPLGFGYIQRGLGDIAIQEGKYSDALDHYKEFLHYVSEVNHLWSVGQAHGKLAFAHAHLGDVSASRLELQKSLSDLQSWPEDQLYVLVLLAEPVCLIHENNHEQAIELAALIVSHRASWNETKQLAQAILEKASDGMPEKVVKAAVKRGEALELEEVITVLMERSTGEPSD